MSSIGIEARGFVLAPMVARQLGVGFSPVRKNDALFPGETSSRLTTTDYRGRQQKLTIRSDHFLPGQWVALVDDWIEIGSQAAMVAELITETGASLVAIAVIIDEASARVKESLPAVHILVVGEDLP